ncbi:hypothetical protein EI94DRAFT_242686 [Lactarius quietus]|nr:hypothetical protein EI94DRAFT_242686 [Lactarius quietus]
MFAPVLSPQSPFKTSFSGLIWCLMQKVHPRRYLDHSSGGDLKPVSSEMSEAQMQLAMEENDERKRRDMSAIHWLLDRLTEDDELESFVLAIPGSFTTEWGIEVWRKASELMLTNSHPDIPPARTCPSLSVAVLPRHDSLPPQSSSRLRYIFHPLGRIIGIRSVNGTLQWTSHTLTGCHPSVIPHTSGDLAVQELCKCVRLLFATCNNRGLFPSEDLWRRRARGCVETASSLVCCAGIKLDVFGDIGDLLGDLGKAEKIRELSAAGSDESFVARWTCLSLVVARGIANDPRMLQSAYRAIVELSISQMENDGDTTTSYDVDENALKGAQLIDFTFKWVREACLNGMRPVFLSSDGFRVKTEEEARKILANERFIPVLETSGPLMHKMMPVDAHCFLVTYCIRQFARGLIENLPGVFFEETHATNPTPPNQVFKNFVPERPTVIPQFIFLRHRLRFLTAFGPKLRDFDEGRGDGVYQDILDNMREIWDKDYDWGLIAYAEDLMERQFWRLQDIRDSGGFGLVVELFFLAFAQLSTASSPDSYSSLYIGTFRAITSDWRQHKNSIGTQRVILNLVCDLGVDSGGMFSTHRYPRFITDELLTLLGHMFEGQSGSHIDHALNRLENPRKEFPKELAKGEFVQGAISRLRPRAPVSS